MRQQTLKSIAWVGLAALAALSGRAEESAAEMKYLGERRVSVTLDGRTATFDVAPLEVVEVKDEKYDKVDHWRGTWGSSFRSIAAMECPAKGALVADSVRLVKTNGTELVRGKDYDYNPQLGYFGRKGDGALGPDEPFLASYRYSRRRMDAVVADKDGNLELVKGVEHISLPAVPPIPSGRRHVANIYVRPDYFCRFNLFPIRETKPLLPPQIGPSLAEGTPKALRKLKSGEKLRILAWGDSVTEAAYLPEWKDAWQEQFVRRLRARYPKAEIELVTVGWGGRTIEAYLKDKADHQFEKVVIDRKPDLVVSEFVNDMGLGEQPFRASLDQVLKRFREEGIEWIVTTPHYVRPDWMWRGGDWEQLETVDTRFNAQIERSFCEDNGIPCADVSWIWGRLGTRGIPYTTLFYNGINHPNAFGLGLYADALMALFENDGKPPKARVSFSGVPEGVRAAVSAAIAKETGREVQDAVYSPDYLIVGYDRSFTNEIRQAFSRAFKGRLVKPNAVVKGSGDAAKDAFLRELSEDFAASYVPNGTDGEIAARIIEALFPKRAPFAVTVDGKPCKVTPCRISAMPFNQWAAGYQRPLNQTEIAGFVAVEANGATSFRVKPERAFRTATVRPLSAKVKPSVQGGEVTFTLPKPGHYVLELDDYHSPLGLFVEPVRDFAKERREATISFGPGLHEPKVVRLRSHDRVYIDRDAVVMGSFQADGVEDVRISGYGVISGARNRRDNDHCYREFQATPIRIIDSRNVVVDGPIVVDSSCWCVDTFNSRDIEIAHVKVAGQWRYNTDGIDICNSENVWIHDCYVHSFDDTIVLKGIPDDCASPVRNVRTERCVLWCSWGRTLELGLETWASEYAGIVFDDCDLIHNSVGAMSVHLGGDAVVKDVTFSNLRLEYTAAEAEPVYQSRKDLVYVEKKPWAGPMFTATNDKFEMFAKPDEKPGTFERVTVKNVDVTVEPGAATPTFEVRAVKGSSFGKLDVSGLRVNGKPFVPPASGEVVWIEAENFAERGAWVVDTQFTHAMGSAYLIAPGVGSPIGAAKTTFKVADGGRRAVWVRTRDWVPAHHPGRFAVGVDGRRLGKTLGASGRTGWVWEKAGEVDLAAGEHTLALEDLSGAFARCDVVVVAGLDFAPGNDPSETEALRAKWVPQPPVAERGGFDVVVVGAGPAGVCAAVAAARNGAKTALVHDRPMAGGNCSDEIGIGTDGAANSHLYLRESGLVEEWNLLNPHPERRGLSDAAALLLAGETNLTVFANERVLSATQKDGVISDVTARNTLTGARTRYAGKVFVDATGDGWVGFYAGADYRFGREAQAEFNEPKSHTPPKADACTMSGCLCFYKHVMRDHAVAYETPAWADILPKGFTRDPGSLKSAWWIEHPNDLDDMTYGEEARDELIRYNFAYWGWVKNQSPMRERAKNAELVSVPVVNGRRESRRLVGDVILTGNDLIEGRQFADRVAFGGWGLDVHDVLGMQRVKGDGWSGRPLTTAAYVIPFRALYSRNVRNLLMAGRCISATHLALGSTRVGATCAVLGQAVGTAAALCVRKDVFPRELGAKHVVELQQALLRDDQYIPGLKNEDPRDLARTARVTASSSAPELAYTPPRWAGVPKHVLRTKDGLCRAQGAAPACVIDGVSRVVETNAHAWVSSGKLPQWIRLDFPKPTELHELRLTFDSDLSLHNTVHYAPTLAKDYRLEALTGGQWKLLADEKDNIRRLRVHRFAPLSAEAVRLTVTAVHGGDEVRVFEIRAE